jgi:mannan endo-1,4-beta-mannosidase
MRRAQSALSRFLPLIDWTRFNRRCWNDALELNAKGFAAFGCGDESQAVLWLLRTDATGRDGRIKPDARPRSVMVCCPAAREGPCRVRFFNTEAGAVTGEATAHASSGRLVIPVKGIEADVAVAVNFPS